MNIRPLGAPGWVALGSVTLLWIVASMLWMREIFYVLRWNMDIQLGIASVQIAMTVIGIVNLRFQLKPVWLVFFAALFAMNLLAVINCSDAILGIFLDWAGPPSGSIYPPFAFVFLSSLIVLLLRVDPKILVPVLLLLFCAAALLLMQKHSIPSAYLVS